FALRYIFCRRSCSRIGAFVISPLPPMLSEALHTVGSLCSTAVTPLQRFYGPLRHPLLLGRLPGGSGYTAYLAPALSRREEEGFSSCVVCPGHRAAASTPPEWGVVSASVLLSMLPSPSRLRARPPGFVTFGATSAFACAAA